MKATPVFQQRKYIDLVDLSNFLQSNWKKSLILDGHFMQLIEEVTFLCANSDFIEDVDIIRKRLMNKFPGLELPRTDQQEACRTLGFFYKYSYNEYKRSIKNIVNKYKLIPRLYWRDKFLMLDSKIERELEHARDYEKKMTKKQARLRVVEKITENECTDLDLLDNIILHNKPFDKQDTFPYWVNPYVTRKTNGISINLERVGASLLEIGFPPYATLPEMQALLKDNYKVIQEYREEHLPLSAKRDHRKDNLPKMIVAYMLDSQGLEKAKIATILDEKFGGDISFEGVAQLISRMKKEANRFSRTKQET